MKFKTQILLLIIFSIGLSLRIFQIGLHSLWCDELLAISLGQIPPFKMINYITFNDAHPPLFYLLVYLWLKLGKNSEIFLRILPLFFGVLCIFLGYFLGKEFKDEKTGLLLSLFISLNPSHILWSQILKSYTLFITFTIISSYLFLKILKEEKKKDFILWTVSNILLLYTHNFGFIVLLAQIFSLIFLKRFNIRFFYSFVATFVFYIPWFLRIPYQLLFTLGVKRPIPFILRYLYTFFYFFFGETLSPLNFFIVIPSFIILVLIFFISIKKFLNLKKEQKVPLLSFLIIPMFFVPFPSTVPQNLIPFSIFWFLFLSFGIEFMEKKNLLKYLIFFCFLPSLIYYYKGEISQYHDPSKLIPYREIFKKIEKIEKYGDIIISTEKEDKFIISPLSWYYKGNCKVIKIKEKSEIEILSKLKANRMFVIIDFVNFPEVSQKIKIFMENNYEKMEEWKYIYNEKLLNRIIQKKREFYYLIEVYLLKRKN